MKGKSIFGEYEHFIVFYTISGVTLNAEHIVGFEEKPTIYDVKQVIDEIIEENLVPQDKGVYMIFMDGANAEKIFFG